MPAADLSERSGSGPILKAREPPASARPGGLDSLRNTGHAIAGGEVGQRVGQATAGLYRLAADRRVERAQVLVRHLVGMGDGRLDFAVVVPRQLCRGERRLSREADCA